VTIDNARRADILAVMGATGSGKSSSVFARLHADPPPRLLAWDFKGEYLAFGRECKSERELYRAAVRAAGFRLVFRPSFDVDAGRVQFDWFCKLAYQLGDVLVVADELHRVMLPNWAPEGWNLLVSMGRSRGARVIAVSQRPALIEKGFWDQATVIRAGRLNGRLSAQALADALLVPWTEVVSLSPLLWLQRSIYEPAIVRGRIEWRRGRPSDVLIEKKPLPGALVA
jgi:hypothetical protein